MAFHSEEAGTSIHVAYAFEYADASARTSATGLVASDVGKFARQLDDNSIWILTDESPVTWSQVGGVGISGSIGVEEGNVSEGTATTIDFDDSDFNVSVAANEADISLNYGTGAGQPAEGNHGHAGVITGFTIELGDGTNDITTSERPAVVRLPVAFTWTRWDIQADASGDIVVDVLRATEGSPNSFSSIAGTNKPTLSGAQSASDTDLTTGWGDDDTDAGDRIKLTVDSATGVTWVAIHFTLTRAL